MVGLVCVGCGGAELAPTAPTVAATPTPEPVAVAVPTPQPVSCAPLDRVGVRVTIRQRAAGEGMTWMFDATPQAITPYTPPDDQGVPRLRWEQLAYKGDPVASYAEVEWIHAGAEKTECQGEPTWRQRFGQGWNEADPINGNPWRAKLSPDAAGVYVVRVCREAVCAEVECSTRQATVPTVPGPFDVGTGCARRN